MEPYDLTTRTKMSGETPTTKKMKIKRVLKSAARLPRVSSIKAGRGSGRNNFSPRPGEPPVVIFRLQVLSCTGLLAKDRTGTSDPFVTVSVLNKREQTSVSKRTLNPVYAAKDATFDFPLYLSLADKLGVVELVVWDKDMLRKDYLGEVAIPLEDWFTDREGGEREFAFDQEGNRPFSMNLVSTRASTPSTGAIQIKLGFVPTPNSQNLMEFDEIYGELVKRTRPSLVSAPPTRGVGTIRSDHKSSDPAHPAHPHGHAANPYAYEDDGGLSSEAEDSDDEPEVFLDASEKTPPLGTASPDVAPACEARTSVGALPPVNPVSPLGLLSPGQTRPMLDIYIPSPPAPVSDSDASTGVNATPAFATTLSLSTSSDSDAPKPSEVQMQEHAVGNVAPKPPFNLPLLNLLPSSPATPTPGSHLPTAVPLSVRSSAASKPLVGFGSEETPKAGANFVLPATASGSATSSTATGGSSRFIPKKFVRKFSGLTGGQQQPPTSPAVDVQGNPTQTPPPASSPAFPQSMAYSLSQSSQSSGLRSVSGPPSSPRGDGSGQEKRRRKFVRNWSSSGQSRSGSASPGSQSGSETGDLALNVPALPLGGGYVYGPGTPGPQTPVTAISLAAPRRPGMGRRKKAEYEFKGAGDDIVGIVMLEIQGADDLPRLANMTRTGWDMDPFVVISFGKKVFRTRVIRHSRNPVWDEKLLFHVRRYETSYKVQLTVLDWDKLSSNDHIGDVALDVRELMESAPHPDPVTGLYSVQDWEKEEDMREFKLPLATTKEMPWETKHNTAIRFRAKYQPYDALRQRFWRQYLKQYDTDNTSSLSHLELTAMLDSLGSTLTRSTISTFFTRYGKNPVEDEISVDQAVMCLEEELGRPEDQKKRVDADDGIVESVSATPVLMVAGEHGEEVEVDLDLGKMDFSAHVGVDSEGKLLPPGTYGGEPAQGSGGETPDLSSDDAEVSSSSALGVSPSAATGAGAASGKSDGKRRLRFRRPRKQGTGDSQTSGSNIKEGSEDSNSGSGSSESNPIERVINVKTCPLCHRPRLNSKAEMDIVTHLAICASQDWNKVDRIVVGNFVTASQAQRKWYTKIISKVSSGNYKLGANSANIIVQNRMTGQLEEEKMQVYVRLGIRLLYKGASSRMEGGRARRLLKSLSIKQGIKYDDPESAKEIPAFIVFHGLKVDDILDPIESFKTFNQFFYRKLKASARPVESPDDPYRLVSAADCRLMAFETVSEATRLWIKGREFTVARLLGDAYKGQAERYAGGALAIFRLAPQDYHRFHSPVEGKVGPMTYIAGEYYTVNPQAIRTALDVYGENARKIVPIDSPHFGQVMAVCIGAMMVGSIKTTVEEGEYVQRGQEFGYFAFGGSTIVILFEKGRVEWDEDLLINGRASLETLVRVGMGIGRGRPLDGSLA